MITDQIAVGDCNSPYEPFDVIVNLDYPHNGATHNAIHTIQNQHNVLYTVCLYDHPSEPIDALLSTLIPHLIVHWYNNPSVKILFHCHAGISRSVTFAAVYLACLYGISARDAYRIIKSRRPIAAPNAGFMKSINRLV